jgi:predicted RecA/RadA family phage recombinase
MKNFIQQGDTLTVAAPYTVTSGQGVLKGRMFGIASYDALITADVDIVLEGVFDINKPTGLAFATVGAVVYWDDNARQCSATDSGNSYAIGVVAKAAGSSDTTVRVRLGGGIIPSVQD